MTSFSPLDLLTVASTTEQDIIRCLIKTPNLNGQEIATRMNLPLDRIEHVLDKMVNDSRLVTETVGGAPATFAVQFERQREPKPKQRAASSVLDSLFG